MGFNSVGEKIPLGKRAELDMIYLYEGAWPGTFCQIVWQQKSRNGGANGRNELGLEIDKINFSWRGEVKESRREKMEAQKVSTKLNRRKGR